VRAGLLSDRDGNPSRILVLRRRALGDLVCSLPALGDLRRAFPGATIDLVMDPSWVAAAKASAPVDNVLALPPTVTARARFALSLRRARYDLVIDLMSTPQTALLSRITGAKTRWWLDLSGRAWAYTKRVDRPGSALDPRGRPTTSATPCGAWWQAAIPRAIATAAAPRPPRRSARATFRRAWRSPRALRECQGVAGLAYAEVAIGCASAATPRSRSSGPREKRACARHLRRGSGCGACPAGSVVDLANRLE
jgi:hypothetical protein